MGAYSKAIGLLLVSALAFAFMGVFVRAAGDLPTQQKTFFCNLVSVAMTFYMLKKSGAAIRVQKRNRWPVLIRVAAGTLATAANYYSYDHMLIADATMLSKISPFFIVLFSAWLMKERVRSVEWAALGVVFAGSVLVIKPSFDFVAMTPALIAALGGVAAACGITMVRFVQLRGESGELILFLFAAFSGLTFLPWVLFGYVPMRPGQFACLMAAGVMVSTGQLLMSAAYKRAPSSVLSVFEYSQVLFSALLGIIMFSQFPDAFSLLGYAVVIGTSALMAAYSRRCEPVLADIAQTDAV